MPVAAISGAADVVGRARVIPVDGWTIASDPDSAPGTAIVVDAMTPSPTPAAPSPGMVVGEEETDADARSEGDERGCYDGAGARRDVDDGGVVLGDVDDLWVGGLNDVDGLIRDLLDLDGLFVVGAERSGGVGLTAQTLDGGSDLCLVSGHGLADGGVVVDVVGHHLEDGGEGDESKEGGIEAPFFGGVGECGAGEFGILGEPVGDVEDLLGISGGGCDLGEQRVGIERNWGHQLI